MPLIRGVGNISVSKEVKNPCHIDLIIFASYRKKVWQPRRSPNQTSFQRELTASICHDKLLYSWAILSR